MVMTPYQLCRYEEIVCRREEITSTGPAPITSTGGGSKGSDQKAGPTPLMTEGYRCGWLFVRVSDAGRLNARYSPE